MAEKQAETVDKSNLDAQEGEADQQEIEGHAQWNAARLSLLCRRKASGSRIRMALAMTACSRATTTTRYPVSTNTNPPCPRNAASWGRRPHLKKRKKNGRSSVAGQMLKL